MMVEGVDASRDTGGVAAKDIHTTTNTRMSIKSDIITSVAKSIPMILHLFQWLDLLILQFLALLKDLLPSPPTALQGLSHERSEGQSKRQHWKPLIRR